MPFPGEQMFLKMLKIYSLLGLKKNSAEALTQDLMHTRQVLYCCSTSSAKEKCILSACKCLVIEPSSQKKNIRKDCEVNLS